MPMPGAASSPSRAGPIAGAPVPDFPLSARQLEILRLAAMRRAPAGQVGAHLRRRAGQGLEPRDHMRWRPGDDARAIDWRASLRQPALGAESNLLVRRFEAEDRLTLAVSIDCRASMALPETAPKLTLARWLATALAILSGQQGDRLMLHQLFQPAPGNAPPPMQGGHGLNAAQRRLLTTPPEVGDDAAPNHASLLPLLRPASVWVIVTDLYWPDPERRLAAAIRRAQEANRWVVVVEIDSWPHEAALLEAAPRLLLPRPGALTAPLRFANAAERLAEADRRVTEAVAERRQSLQRGGLSLTRWSYPASPEPPDLPALFAQFLFGDAVLQRLWRRQAS